MTTNRFTPTDELEMCNRYQTMLPSGDLPTAVELGLLYACSDGTIRNILRRHGVKPRSNRGRIAGQKFDLPTQLAICNYYWTRLPNGYYPSYEETADVFGCSAPHVRDLLKRHQFKRRKNHETREMRPCKPINQPDSPAPLCACGCGQITIWKSKDRYWTKYAKGHYRGKQRKIVQGEDAQPWEAAPMPHGWKKISQNIKTRDDSRCQICKKRYVAGSGYLHAHHIDENRSNSHPHNLICLCARCHAPIHGNEEIRPRLIEIAIKNSEAMPDGWVTWEIH